MSENKKQVSMLAIYFCEENEECKHRVIPESPSKFCKYANHFSDYQCETQCLCVESHADAFLEKISSVFRKRIKDFN